MDDRCTCHTVDDSYIDPDRKRPLLLGYRDAAPWRLRRLYYLLAHIPARTRLKIAELSDCSGVLDIVWLKRPKLSDRGAVRHAWCECAEPEESVQERLAASAAALETRIPIGQAGVDNV